jgi:toxin YoeB
MADKKIIWSDNAKTELRKVLEFYTERNGLEKHSLKILEQTEELLNLLSKREFIGRLTSNKTTRVIPMKVYLIIYELNENSIEIVSFWDNRQDENIRKIN